MNEQDAIRKIYATNPVARRLLDQALHGEGPDPTRSIVVIAGDWPSSINGSLRGTCARCYRYVSLAPSTQAMMRRHQAPVEIRCTPCSMAAIERGEEDHTEP